MGVPINELFGELQNRWWPKADNTEELQQVIEEQSGITDSTYENALLIVPSNIDAEIDLH